MKPIGKDKKRFCKDKSCEWHGTREEALGPFEYNGRGPYWICPECGASLENDYRVTREHRYLVHKIRKRCIDLLKNEYSRATSSSLSKHFYKTTPHRIGMVLRYTDCVGRINDNKNSRACWIYRGD